MGGILEVSGAAEQLAFTFIRVIGKRKEEWAAKQKERGSMDLACGDTCCESR